MGKLSPLDVATQVELWRAAPNLEAVAMLMARWLTGDISYNPQCVADGPDAETGELIDRLAAYNRRGFLTDFSQPGMLDADYEQRASVSGACSEELAETIAATCLRTDLICMVCWPGESSNIHVPVTIQDGAAFTWSGMASPPEVVMESWEDHLSTSALLDVVSAHQVTVIDPVWGRNDVLWRTLDEVIAASPRLGALPRAIDSVE